MPFVCQSIKAGILHADAHPGFSGTVSDEPFTSRLTVINTHPLYGAGLGYNIDSHSRIQSAFNTYRDVGSASDVSGFRVVGPNQHAHARNCLSVLTHRSRMARAIATSLWHFLLVTLGISRLRILLNSCLAVHFFKLNLRRRHRIHANAQKLQSPSQKRRTPR
jgi:hypothetical protein